MRRTHLTGLVFLLVSAVGFVAQAAAQPVLIYVSVKGAKTGPFKGESLQRTAAAEQLIQVFGVSYEVASPRDVATGQGSGKLQYKPIVILKELGPSSPQFFGAAATNEVLSEVKIEFFHANANSQTVQFYTITLTNATIADVRTHTGHGESLASVNGHQYEEISFTFQKITIQDIESKTMAMDDWMAR